MRSGTMLMWEGGLWHGGGANTSKDRERLGFFMSHNVAYLRPQEIQLALRATGNREARCRRELQRLLGLPPLRHRRGRPRPHRRAATTAIVFNPTAKLAERSPDRHATQEFPNSD